MLTLISDLRFALRTFAKAPVFTVVAVLSLALGIGANTAIFTLLDQVLLRTLPVKNPEQLVLLSWVGSHPGANRGQNSLSYPMYKDFRDQNQVFTGMLCRFATSLSLSFGGATEQVSGELVSGNYFDVLGVGSSIGRVFTPGDDRQPGGHPLVVLSHDFWQNRFHGDPQIAGKTVHINSFPMTVIGVAQRNFHGVDLGFSPQVFVPVAMKKEMTPTWNDLDNRTSKWVQVFGRLKPGISEEQAKASLQPIFKSILRMEVEQEPFFQKTTPFTKERFLAATIDVLPGGQGRPQFRERFSKPLMVLMSIVGLVLLIACANVASLLLARATARQKEMAVRLAMGAKRSRLVRQLVTESLLLSMTGAATGLVLAYWTDRILLTMLPVGTSPLKISAEPDFRVFLFTAGVAVVTGLLFGLAPAWQGTKTDLASTLKDQASAVAGGGAVRFRKALVVGQVTLSLLLLIGAGLFIQSLRNLRTLDTGFRASHLIAFTVDPMLNGYKPEQTIPFYARLHDSLRNLPGVQAVSLSGIRLLDGGQWTNGITVEGYQAKQDESVNAWFNVVSPDYFQTMGIPLLAGREFSPADAASKTQYVLVNEKFAKHYFKDRTAVGRHIGMGGNPGTKTDIEIVGVVKDTVYRSMREPIPMQVFANYAQTKFASNMSVYVRTRLNPNQMYAAVRHTVKSIDSNLPMFNLRTIEEQMNDSLLVERMVAMLSTAFGVIATLLAIVGLYGVMAYSVTRRTREIGIRIALGAFSKDVVWLVMREVVVLVALGVIIGLGAAYGLTRYLEGQLYGLTPNDPLTIACATALLALVAAAAGYIPAWRAARVDPLRALRYE